jgi:hypothetical protein
MHIAASSACLLAFAAFLPAAFLPAQDASRRSVGAPSESRPATRSSLDPSFTIRRTPAAPRATASAAAATTSTSAFDAARFAAIQDPQDRDYSPRALYRTNHQNFLSGSTRYRPQLELSYLFQHQTEVKGDPGHLDLDHYRVNGRIPIHVDPDTALLFGPNFGARHYSSKRAGQSSANETLYTAGVHVGFTTFVNDDVQLTAVFSPGVYSDLDASLHSEDWKFYGDVLATFRASDDLYFKIGAMYSGDFDDAPVLPLLGLSVKFLDDFRFDMLLPKEMELSWQFTTTSILTFGVYLQGDEFRVRNSVANGKVAADYNVQEIRTGVGIVQRLTDNFSFLGQAGLVVAGDYRYVDNNGNRFNGTLEPELYLFAGIGIDF